MPYTRKTFVDGSTTVPLSAAELNRMEAGIKAANDAVDAGVAGYTDEQAQDAAAALLTTGAHTGITATYVDGSNRVDLTVTGGGGGGSPAPLLAAPLVGDWVGLAAPSMGAQTVNNGQLILGELVLAPGTYDSATLQITTGATGATVRIGIYADDGGRPGALLYGSAALGATTAGMVTVTGLTITSTTPARKVWAGVAAQGANVAMQGTNTSTAQIVRSSTPSGDAWFSPATAWSITGVTADLPTTGSAATRLEKAIRVLLRRSV